VFEFGSSWQSDDESPEEDPKLSPEIGSKGSLVEPGFRSKFAENQRQLSTGTSFTSAAALRKNRSSVRFADDGNPTSGKGKDPMRCGTDQQDVPRERSNSQALADSDDECNTGMSLPRVQSQLSMMIDHRRSTAGGKDLGYSQPPSAKASEAQRKREELLAAGRAAAAPIIPQSRSRRPSLEEEIRRYRSPSPGATF
jgi:hypothetical protein